MLCKFYKTVFGSGGFTRERLWFRAASETGEGICVVARNVVTKQSHSSEALRRLLHFVRKDGTAENMSILESGVRCPHLTQNTPPYPPLETRGGELPIVLADAPVCQNQHWQIPSSTCENMSVLITTISGMKYLLAARLQRSIPMIRSSDRVR